MKKMYSLLFLSMLCGYLPAQVALPVTLNFTSNDPAAWADGVAQDGNGGASKISGLDIQIFAANSSTYTLLPGATMIWHNNAYYASGDAAFNGITPGPDVTVTNDGVPALVIKSTVATKNFSLKSIQLYDWGGSFWTIRTYDNGSLVGSIDISFDQTNWNPKTISQSNELLPAFFQNIDEIRIVPKGATATWPAINKILLDNPVNPLPVSLHDFTARAGENNSVMLNWNTASEQSNAFFIVERSLNGQLFDAIDTIRGNGTSASVHHYQYTDKTNHLPAKKMYYRLKQADINGHTVYSKVVVFDYKKFAEQLVVYPNPANSHVKVKIPGNEINLVLKIYDVAGKMVWSRKYEQSAQISPIDVSKLVPGSYQLLIQKNDGTSNSLSFMKQ